MRLGWFLTGMLTAAVATQVVLPANADSITGEKYPATRLVAPCQDADSDAREVGQVAELECEQYILGFLDALAEVGASGPGTGICVPEQNTADEVRWAFVRWVYGDFSKRKSMPAADALLASLKDSFPCK